MTEFENKLKKYADVVIRFGINLQQGEYLVISADVNDAMMVRALTESAYELGAKRVIALYSDEQLTKINYTYASVDSLSNLFPWEVERKNFVADIKACYIGITSDNPDLLKDIDSKKISTVSRNLSPLFNKFREESGRNNFKWCIIAAASKAWADRIFPNDNDNVEKLWDLIFQANRIDREEPIKEWQKHIERLQKNCKTLNKLKLKRLVYKNSLGTDLTVELPDNYQFLGGSELSQDKCLFTANLPTEEIFSAPKRNGVNGKLFASLPLCYKGKIIKNFGFEFKDGKVVDCFAESGLETINEILDIDDGAKYLGEVALISFDSPINNTNTLYYSTLYDENARCHFALGMAYPSCVEGGEALTADEMLNHGLNVSQTHIDFMVGTDDLSVIGETSDGKKVDIIINGNIVI